jgi:hypothetical protein
MTDADALNLIGTDKLVEHFQCSRQNIYAWRTNGIPKTSRRPVKLLGESLGHDMGAFPAEMATT